MQIRRRTLDAWFRDLEVDWGQRLERSAREVSPMLARCEPADLHTIGSRLAAEGHTLDDTLACLHLLARRSRAFRSVLEQGGVGAVADGWADGVLTDGFGSSGAGTGVAPLEVLRLRLLQQVEQARDQGKEPGRCLALVVIEVSGAAGTAQRVVHHARRVFREGETMALTPSGKLIVLTSRDHDLRRRTLLLTDALRHEDQLRDVPVRVWIEPLATSAEHADSHLLGLAS